MRYKSFIAIIFAIAMINAMPVGALSQDQALTVSDSSQLITTDVQQDLAIPLEDRYNLSAIISNSFSISGQDGLPTDITWNDDGTKMYIAGSSNNNIYEYDVSTAYDVSSAAFSKSFDVSSQDSNPEGLTWNNAGTKLYIAGETNDAIFEYDVSDPFNISSASFTQSLSIATEDSLVRGIAFNNDGTKMYIIGDNTDKIYEYTLSNAFDISTASLLQTKGIGSQDSIPTGLTWSNDGAKLYITGASSDSVHEYDVSTAFDVSTATASTSFSSGVPEDVSWNDDGSRMYVIDQNSDTISQFIAQSFELSSANSPVTSKDFNSFDSFLQDVDWNNDGTKMYLTGFNSNTIYEFNASDPYNVLSTTYTGNSFDYSAQETFMHGMEWSSDGTKFLMTGAVGDNIYEYDVSTSFNISTASFNKSFDVSGQTSSPEGIGVNDDGTRVYISKGFNPQRVLQYTLTEPFNIATASFTGEVGVGDPRNIKFNNDGTKMFVITGGSDRVVEFVLSDPYNVSTATFARDKLVGAEETNPFGISWNGNGTRLFITGGDSNDVFQYDATSTVEPFNDPTFNSSNTWPMWYGNTGGQRNSDQQITTSEGTLTWSVLFGIPDIVDGNTLNGDSYQSRQMAVHNGTLYFAAEGSQSNDDGYLFAINATTGSQVWATNLTALGFSTVGYLTVDNDSVFLSHDGNVSSFSRTDGSHNWRTDFNSGNARRPVYHNGSVYVYTSNFDMFALDASNGNERYNFSLPGNNAGGMGNWAPTVFNDGVYDMIIVAHDDSEEVSGYYAKNGTQRWSNQVTNPDGDQVALRSNMAFVRGPPAIITFLSGIGFSPSFNAKAVAVYAENGTFAWNQSIAASDTDSDNSVMGSVAYHENSDSVIVAGNAGEWYKINADNGDLRGTFSYQTVASSDDRYGEAMVDSNNTLVIVGVDHRFSDSDNNANNGVEAWDLSTDTELWNLTVNDVPTGDAGIADWGNIPGAAMAEDSVYIYRPDSNDWPLGFVTRVGEQPPTAPAINNSSADPNNENVLGDVTLSINVSDLNFPNDNLTADFYLDGSLNGSVTNITSNATVQHFVGNVVNTSHSWHAVVTDNSGLTSTSDTFSFVAGPNKAPSVNNSSAMPSGITQESARSQLSIDVSDPNFPNDIVTVGIWFDGTLVGVQEISSNQTVTQTIFNIQNGTHTWNVSVFDEGGLADESEVFSFTVLHHPPVIDNGSATPNGTTLEEDTRLQIDVGDLDFQDDTGDVVTVTFFINGEAAGTDELFSNGTASVQAGILGGTNNWSVTAVDRFGHVVASANFTFEAPGNLFVRNETNHTQLVLNSSLEYFFDRPGAEDDIVVEQDAPNGIGDMTGLPVNEPFVVVASSNGYFNRRIYVTSLFDTENIYLLNTNESAVQPTFDLIDFTGRYPQEDTVLQIQRNINGSWQTVEGDFFGAAGEVSAQLEFNERHRLIVINTITNDTRELGIFTPVTSGAVILEVHPDDTIIRAAELPFIGINPTVGSLPATENVTIEVTFRNTTDTFANFHAKAVVNTTTGQDVLFNQSSFNPEGTTFTQLVNLTGYEGRTLTVYANWTLSDGQTGSSSETFLIRESFNNQHSLLSIITGLPSRIPASTAGAFTAFITLLVVAVATSYTATRASTEIAAFVGLAFLGGFMMIDWVPFGWFFVATVATFSLAALRRGL